MQALQDYSSLIFARGMSSAPAEISLFMEIPPKSPWYTTLTRAAPGTTH